MEDVIIVGGIIVALWLLHRNEQQANPNGTAIPTAMGISSAPSLSGGYQTLPPGFVQVGSSPTSLSATVIPPPVPAPPPPYYGGTVGGVGSGGNPLGGSLRAGVSAGTGTTVPYRAPTAGVLNPGAIFVGSDPTLPAGHR